MQHHWRWGPQQRRAPDDSQRVPNKTKTFLYIPGTKPLYNWV
jgi:hypothetical protein